MKIAALAFLSVSLALNGVGLVRAWRTPAARSAGAPVAAGEPPTDEAAALRQTASELNAVTATGDPEALAAWLRQAGFPRWAVWHVVADAVYARHEAELVRVNADYYWSAPESYDPARLAVVGAVEDEIERLAGPGPSELHRRTVKLAGIAADKIPQVEAIQKEGMERLRALYRARSRFYVPEVDDPAIERQERQTCEAVGALLTPEEKFEYLLRNSPDSLQARTKLAAMQPTEAEFRAIFASEQDSAPADARESRLKAELGEARYAEYRRTQDPVYQNLRGLVKSLEQPPENATAVYTLQNELQAKAERIRADASLNEDSRALALAALAKEAESRITARLGSEGWRELKRSGEVDF